VLIADDFQVYGCGGNEKGQLGLGARKDRLVPAPVALHSKGTAASARRVSCGFGHSLLLTGGSLWVLGGRSAPSPMEAFSRPLYASNTTPWRVRGQIDRLEVTDIGAGGGHGLCCVSEAVYSFGVAQGDSMDRDNPAPQLVEHIM